MDKHKPMIQWRAVPGRPITVGDVTVTPQAQVLTVRWPRGGFVWNRPSSVLVSKGGMTRRVPIVDVTRVIQLGILATVIVLGIVLRVRRSAKKIA